MTFLFNDEEIKISSLGLYIHIAILLTVSISLITIISAIYSKKIAAQLADIANTAEKISKGNFNERVKVENKKGEILRLATAFNEMVKKLEESLQFRESDKKYAENIIESANTIIIGGDLKGIVRIFNKEAENITGYKKEEVIGRNFFEIFAPKEIAAFIQQRFMEWAMSNQDYVRNSQYPLVTKSGDNRIIAWRNSVVKEDGKITGTISFGIDITDQKKAEEFEERLVSILNASPDFISLFDREGNILYLNRAGRRMAGVPEGEYVSSTTAIYDYYPESERERIKNEWLPVAEQDGIWSGETSILNRTGYEIPVSQVIIAHKENDGTLRYFSCIARDITEIKQMLSVLDQSERRFRALFEESKDMVYMSVPEGYFIDINQAGVELLGYSSKEEAMQIDITTSLYLNPINRKKLADALENYGFVKDFETVFIKKNGDLINVLLTSTNVRDDTGKTVMYRGIIRDITEQKKLEQQLLHAQKMEAIGQLAGGIAHDFNNIMTAIIGYGSIIQRKLDADDPLYAYVDPLLASAEKAANLTQSLLTFSRKQVMNPRPIDLNSIISGLQKLMSRLISEEIELKISLSSEHLTIFADKGQIEQVLMNLVANARDAMPDGGVLTINTDSEFLDNVFIRTHGYGKQGEYVVFSVSDTGIGMDEKTRLKVFEPFFTTKEIGKGTGLGLSMVYGIIKQHNGYINLYSEPGKGTIFKIYIPLEKKRSVEEKVEKELIPSGKGEMILIAEDESEIRNLISALLDEFGYKVIAAVDGEDAVSKFKEHKDEINLLIFDVIMPKKSGKDAYSEIKKIVPNIKAIFVSGYGGDIITQKGLIDENAKFIPKPISPNAFLKAIRSVLDS